MFEFFNEVSNWLHSGSYGWASQLIAYAMTYLFKTYLDFVLWAVPFAWSIGSTVIQNLQISEHLNSAFGALPDTAANLLRFFRIPEVISNLLSAYVAKFVVKFIPGV